MTLLKSSTNSITNLLAEAAVEGFVSTPFASLLASRFAFARALAVVERMAVGALAT